MCALSCLLDLGEAEYILIYLVTCIKVTSLNLEAKHPPFQSSVSLKSRALLVQSVNSHSHKSTSLIHFVLTRTVIDRKEIHIAEGDSHFYYFSIVWTVVLKEVDRPLLRLFL